VTSVTSDQRSRRRYCRYYLTYVIGDLCVVKSTAEFKREKTTVDS
jgi:hypothetical protein